MTPWYRPLTQQLQQGILEYVSKKITAEIRNDLYGETIQSIMSEENKKFTETLSDLSWHFYLAKELNENSETLDDLVDRISMVR